MQSGVDSHLAEVEPNDPVEGGFGFGTNLFEHTGFDPVVASSPQRRVRHMVLKDRFDVHTHDAPVTRRMRMPRKHSRSATRGR